MYNEINMYQYVQIYNSSKQIASLRIKSQQNSVFLFRAQNFQM